MKSVFVSVSVLASKRYQTATLAYEYPPGQFGCGQHRGGGSPSVCSRSLSAVAGGTGPSAALGLDSPVPCSYLSIRNRSMVGHKLRGSPSVSQSAAAAGGIGPFGNRSMVGYKLRGSPSVS